MAGRSTEGGCLMGTLVWLAALALACTTTVVSFDRTVSTGGVGGARSGAASTDGGGGDGTSGDASALPTLPTSPSFDEAFVKGMVTGNAGRYVQVKCCASDGTTNCVSHVLGGTISCLDQFSWKQDGAAICAGLGLTFFDYAVYGDCTSVDLTNVAQIKSFARIAEFQCCLDGSNCVKEIWSSNDLCFSEEAWTTMVKTTCKELGSDPRNLTLYGPC